MKSLSTANHSSSGNLHYLDLYASSVGDKGKTIHLQAPPAHQICFPKNNNRMKAIEDPTTKTFELDYINVEQEKRHTDHL